MTDTLEKVSEKKRRPGDGTPGPGRPKGVPNKATQAIKEWALEQTEFTRNRILQLVASDDEAIALKAIREIWNRAYGMPSQHITAEGGLGAFIGIKIVTGDDKPVVEISSEAADPAKLNGRTKP